MKVFANGFLGIDIHLEYETEQEEFKFIYFIIEKFISIMEDIKRETIEFNCKLISYEKINILNKAYGFVL